MSKLVAVLGILAGSVRAEPAACITADPSCKESLAVGDFNFRYFRSYSLQEANLNIQRAVIVIHGL